jgi:hypothetical protein
MITMLLGTILFHNLIGITWGYAFLSSWFLWCLLKAPRTIVVTKAGK